LEDKKDLEGFVESDRIVEGAVLRPDAPDGEDAVGNNVSVGPSVANRS
jgi:hypothetical protein